MDPKPDAVVLLSGGLDSATTLAIATDMGFACHALTFRYHQRHLIEIESARRVASALNAASHRIIDIDLAQFGHSALTDPAIPVPKDRPHIGVPSDIPITYVPARNLIFLSFAAAFAETISAFDIFIGTNATDYSGYPDCRPEFTSSFESTANLATAATTTSHRKFKIRTPIIEMSKSEIILTGTRLGVDYSLTHSCYDPAPDGSPCSRCDSCILRRKGFRDANLTDPLIYPD